MTPTELRAALQRTFDIRLSPPQLGAVAHLFGMGGDNADADACDGGVCVCVCVCRRPIYFGRHYSNTRVLSLILTCLVSLRYLLVPATCCGRRPRNVTRCPAFHDAVFTSSVQIEVPEFLTTFFKISAVAKRLAARSDSAAKLIEYRVALKVGMLYVCRQQKTHIHTCIRIWTHTMLTCNSKYDHTFRRICFIFGECERQHLFSLGVWYGLYRVWAPGFPTSVLVVYMQNIASGVPTRPIFLVLPINLHEHYFTVLLCEELLQLTARLISETLYKPRNLCAYQTPN